MVERFLACADGGTPSEVKIFIFDGAARIVQCLLPDPARGGR